MYGLEQFDRGLGLFLQDHLYATGNLIEKGQLPAALRNLEVVVHILRGHVENSGRIKSEIKRSLLLEQIQARKGDG